MTLPVSVPGGTDLALEHLVLDANGTLTDRGHLIAGVDGALERLRATVTLHLLSADTFGGAEELAATLHAVFRRVSTGDDKLRYLEPLGPLACVAVGNGHNDAPMLRAAGLSIAVIGPEGAHRAALGAADVVARSIGEALALLGEPQALTATLRP